MSSLPEDIHGEAVYNASATLQLACYDAAMRQFSIKNDHAVELLERIARLTGEGKTEAVVQALEPYQTELLGSARAERVIASIRTAVHPYVSQEHKGRAPAKAEIEAELEMP